MMKTAQWLAAAALLLVASGALAARPTSIVFKNNGETTDGTPYAQFTVKCNDGRSVPLTAWEGRRKWCVGESARDVCESRQINAAKAACMDA